MKAATFFVMASIALCADTGGSLFTGTWRGESICVANKTICKDEVVIYQISKSGTDHFKISADKVVDAKRLDMGDLSCRETQRDDLVCKIPKGEWRFHVNGKKITGTINLTDGTVYRRVAVTKAE